VGVANIQSGEIGTDPSSETLRGSQSCRRVEPPDFHGAIASQSSEAAAFDGWTDGDLMGALERKNEGAYAELYRRHFPSVAAVARMILGSGGPGDEVVADVFVALWLSPATFDPKRGSLPTFLRLRARRCSIDVLRSEMSRTRREQRDDCVSGLSPAPAVDSAVLASERAADLRAAVAALRPGEREAIRLAFFEGMTYQAVAAFLNVAEGTVKSRIRSGLRHLSSSDAVLVYRDVESPQAAKNLSSVRVDCEAPDLGEA
jgi:RNA polymerase sigma factor (sigma-70 family)